MTTAVLQKSSSQRSDGLDQTAFIHLVPKTWEENLAYRLRMREIATQQARMRHSLWICCRRDVLFWVNAFVYIEEPRFQRVLPFITYPFQDDTLVEMVRAVGHHPLHIKKSRDMGVSWMLIAAYTWFWLFQPNCTFLLGSRKEEYVDSSDTKSLFGKIMFILRHLPPWMVPRYSKTHLHLINHERHSSIDGEASNPNWGRGDRRTGMGKDEFAFWPDDFASLAATDDATLSRIWVSTPNGPHTAFFKLGKNKEIRRLRLHWTLHPEKIKGLYSTENGRVAFLDPHYKHPSDYQFILDGKIRSPWYDAMCRERDNDKVRIGQELDLDDYGSIQQFFDDQSLDRYTAQYAEEPWHIGELEFDGETLEPTGWSPVMGGRWKLWLHPDAAGKMPTDRAFVVACDIGAGTGGESSSNSTIAIGDCLTRRLVAEFAAPDVTPETLARIAVAACKAFKGVNKDDGGAKLNWEVNGYGAIFGKTVIDIIRYRHVEFRKTSEESISRKETDKPGWWSSRETKTSLFGDLRRAMNTSPPEIIVTSHECLQEMREYTHGPGGMPEHPGSRGAQDPSGAGDAHGDRVVPVALINRMLKDAPKGQANKPEKPGLETFAGRQRAYKDRKREKEYWS